MADLKKVKLTESQVIEKDLIEKAKKTSVKEASAYSFMDGFGLRYVSPFALAIGANNFQIGLLNSIPSLIGNLSQLFTLKAMDKYSRKRIVFWAVFLQAIMWLSLIGIGALYFLLDWKNSLPAYGLIICYTLLILFGAFGGPAWQSWMKDLITEDSGHYFGRRGRIAGTIALICMIIAGFILDYFKNTKVFIGFFIIFFIAFTGRLVSAILMLKQYEPSFKPDKDAYFSLFQFIRKMRHNNFGKFVMYFSLVSSMTAIASPFFAVFMLRELHFSYIQFMIVTLSSSISTLIFVVPWGRFADKYGNLSVMRITGLFTPFVPLLWVLATFILGESSSHLFFWLIVIELFSGMVWAGFNLSGGNFIYDAVTRQRMAICTSYFSILNGVGILIGSTIGGALSSLGFNILTFKPLLFVFLLSGVARILVYLFFNNRIKEVRIVENFDHSFFFKDIGREIKSKVNLVKDISLGKFFEENQVNVSRVQGN